MAKRTVSASVLSLLLILLLASLAVLLDDDLAEVKAARDKTPPTGSIVINNGDFYTNSTLVNLTLTAYDPQSGITEVRYSNSRVFWLDPWEDFSENKSWTLTTGDGAKTVYYQIKNNDDLTSTTYSDTIILNTQPTPTPSPTPTATLTPTATETPSPTP